MVVAAKNWIGALRPSRRRVIASAVALWLISAGCGFCLITDQKKRPHDGDTSDQSCPAWLARGTGLQRARRLTAARKITGRVSNSYSTGYPWAPRRSQSQMVQGLAHILHRSSELLNIFKRCSSCRSWLRSQDGLRRINGLIDKLQQLIGALCYEHCGNYHANFRGGLLVIQTAQSSQRGITKAAASVQALPGDLRSPSGRCLRSGQDTGR